MVSTSNQIFKKDYFDRISYFRDERESDLFQGVTVFT